MYNPSVCLHVAHSGVLKRHMEYSLAKYGGKTMVFWSPYWIFISHLKFTLCSFTILYSFHKEDFSIEKYIRLKYSGKDRNYFQLVLQILIIMYSKEGHNRININNAVQHWIIMDLANIRLMKIFIDNLVWTLILSIKVNWGKKLEH